MTRANASSFLFLLIYVKHFLLIAGDAVYAKSWKQSKLSIPNSTAAFVSISRGPHSRNMYIDNSLRKPTFINMTFDFLPSNKEPSTTSTKISYDVMKQLSNDQMTLPYQIQVGNKNLVLRHLEFTDLSKVVRICVQEFGSYKKPKPGISATGYFDLNTKIGGSSGSGDDVATPKPFSKLREFVDDALSMYENFCFAFVVQLGLDQRIQRRKEGEDLSRPTIPPDHNVLCLVALNDDGTEGEAVGIAEVSVQPLIPTRTAPPVVLPMSLKRVISKTNGLSSSPVAYVSNVVVDETCRGLGYGKILMCASEGRAKTMGFDQLYLHVDANSSGKTAQSLYWRLGYEAFVQEEDSQFAWMGQDFTNKGLVLVEGTPLLFLKKNLQ